MNNAIFDDSSLTKTEQESLSTKIEELSRLSAMGSMEHYEFISKQRAIMSRAKMDSLTEEEKIYLRMYGRFGLVINALLRRIKPKQTLALKNPLQRSLINMLRNELRINNAEDISTVNPSTFQMKIHEREPIMTSSFRITINHMIDTYSADFSHSDYLYRVSRAKKGIYVEKGISGPVSLGVLPGEVLQDEAFWSTTFSSEVALFRYSTEGQKASNRHPLAPDEEEILYVIENNEHLKGIDVSGFKMNKDRESRTSGEVLVKSDTLFKVIGIQKPERGLQRKVVILRPINSDLKPTETLRNPFTGELKEYTKPISEPT